jgi:hypothetical protein
MKNSLKKLCVIPILVMILMSGCSSSEDTASTNTNAAQSSNTNAAPPIAQRESPAITDNANTSVTTAPVQKILPNGKPAIQPGVQPPASVAATDKAPKLVAPSQTIEFGKQPQGKILVRSFQIRNAGSAELDIENVQPG